MKLTRMDGGEGVGEPIDHVQTKEHLQQHDPDIVDIPLPRIQKRRLILYILREPTFRNSRLLQGLDG